MHPLHRSGFVRSLLLLSLFGLALMATPAQAVHFELRLYARNANLEVQEVVVEEADLRPYLTTIEITDPIFAKDGPQQFGGIPIAKLPELLGLTEFEGDVTMLANDGYSTHEPLEDLIQAGALLAFEQNGKPISPRRGGPLKVVSEQNRDIGLYTWYVERVLFGHLDLVPAVQVQQGDAVEEWSRERLMRAPQAKLARVLPIPRGVRKGVMVPNESTDVGVVALHHLVPHRPANQSLELHSTLGSSLLLPPETDLSQVLVAYSLEGNPIPETFGGGFVVLPVQPATATAALFPNKLEAFFHLESIRVK